MVDAALVDSNVYVVLLKLGHDPVRWLGDRFEDVYTCGMVRLEVLRGQGIPSRRERMARFFDVLYNVPVDNSLWEDAAARAWEMDRCGKVIPTQDHIIAACALRAGVPVLTADKHFREIEGLPVLAFRP